MKLSDKTSILTVVHTVHAHDLLFPPQACGSAATVSRWGLSPWWATFSTDSHRVSPTQTHILSLKTQIGFFRHALYPLHWVFYVFFWCRDKIDKQQTLEPRDFIWCLKKTFSSYQVRKTLWSLFHSLRPVLFFPRIETSFRCHIFSGRGQKQTVASERFFLCGQICLCNKRVGFDVKRWT